MSYQLRGGQTTSNPKLDRLTLFDPKSKSFGVRGLVLEKTPRSMSYRCEVHLDQGQEGACVGAGCSHELACLPVAVPGITMQFAREQVYWPAQDDDPWAGGARPGSQPHMEGTAVLSGVKVLHRLGYCTGYVWSFGLSDAIKSLGHKGPGIVGLNWYTGMFTPDTGGYIHPTGQVEGGHCLLVKALRLIWQPRTTTVMKRSDQWLRYINQISSFVKFHQSWGINHGINGDVFMNLEGFGRLLAEDGEFVTLTGRQRKVSSV